MQVESIRTPCIGVCKIDWAGKYCEGCWRTKEEIAGWSTLSDKERETIIGTLKERTINDN